MFDVSIKESIFSPPQIQQRFSFAEPSEVKVETATCNLPIVKQSFYLIYSERLSLFNTLSPDRASEYIDLASRKESVAFGEEMKGRLVWGER